MAKAQEGRLQDKITTKARMRGAQAIRDQLENAPDQVSLTDPDARSMNARHRYRRL